MASTSAISALTHLGTMPVAQFLREYWQQQPLLIRNALPHFHSPLTPNQLAGLAMEEAVESRLVIEHHTPNRDQQPWELQCGPFSEQCLQQLPDSRWTLLVQAVNHWIPEVNELLAAFRFLPSWRLDDIMVSYAPDQGSVGPHYDHYDVFLLQATGKRRWRLGQQCSSASPCLPDLPINILAQFQQHRQWLLEPGDMLYIPPQLAHWGIAEGDNCITYSIGFRAPAHADLVGDFSCEISAGLPADQRYKDPGIKPQGNPGELTRDALSQVQSTLQSTLVHHLNDTDYLAEWFGRYMTTPKYDYAGIHSESGSGGEDWLNTLNKPGMECQWQPHTRVAYYPLHGDRSTASGHHNDPAQQAQLFVDGESYQSPLQLAQLLGGQTRFQAIDFAPFQNLPEALTLLTELLHQGSLKIAENG